MTESRRRDQLLYGILAVVFTALAFIIAWNIPGRGVKRQVFVPVEQQIINANTPQELMGQLEMTVDDGGKSDVTAIEKEALSL